MAIDIRGQRFGRLVVVDRAENDSRGKSRWLCECDCGQTKVVVSYSLKSGRTRSCGCLHREVAAQTGRRVSTTHGETNTRLYNIWLSMRQRCSYKKGKEYHNYGGRGITVCAEWLNDYISFRNWALANGYADDLTLDREDTNKGYSPENCRWATYAEQENNRRNNRLVTIKNETKTLSMWAKDTGIASATLAWRIDNNWPEEDLFIPVNLNNRIIRRKQNA